MHFLSFGGGGGGVAGLAGLPLSFVIPIREVIRAIRYGITPVLAKLPAEGRALGHSPCTPLALSKQMYCCYVAQAVEQSTNTRYHYLQVFVITAIIFLPSIRARLPVPRRLAGRLSGSFPCIRPVLFHAAVIVCSHTRAAHTSPASVSAFIRLASSAPTVPPY